jgi:L-ascorbate metabolism protein UlaG (beta-lactamase superfamily)
LGGSQHQLTYPFIDTATRLGPPDVAFLPIAAGSVLPFLETLFPITINHAITSSVHMTPQDAVEVSRVLKARKSVGIHWGTFTTDRQARETARQVREQDGIIGEDENGGVVLPVIGAWEAIETSDGKALSCLGL